MSAYLFSIYNEDGLKKIPEMCRKAREQLTKIKECYERLIDIVPDNEFHKYNNFFRYQTGRAAHLVLFLVYLETGKLCSRKEFTEVIGVSKDQNHHFPLNIDEYIHGSINMVQDLVRFAVTCVTYGDYETPVQIANFVINFNKSMSLLRVTKEGLRRRIRALNYNVKAIEDLIYDLSLRNHIKPDIILEARNTNELEKNAEAKG
ncbi:translin isoform X2 [Nilaparvata lugens]|nr:translin isoform X2 [Nilaparvata lugens]